MHLFTVGFESAVADIRFGNSNRVVLVLLVLYLSSWLAFRASRRLDYCSSQGCPFECSFCADPMVYRQRWSGLRAERVVEGVISGLHRSPYHGFSVEFAQHREYVPGDEIRRIDWKAYGKFDRYFIKEYEEETNLRAYLLLDASASMDYGAAGLRKFDYGCYLAVSLAYLMLRQGDDVGLVTFGAQVQRLRQPQT